MTWTDKIADSWSFGDFLLALLFIGHSKNFADASIVELELRFFVVLLKDPDEEFVTEHNSVSVTSGRP